MQSVLAVSAVIDTQTPAAWIVDLTDRLEQHPSILLSVVCLPSNQNSASHTTPPMTTAGRLAQWALTRFIDKPLFSQQPWQPSTLASDIRVVSASSSDSDEHSGAVATTLKASDIIVNLTQSALPLALLNGVSAPIWCAHDETLHARAQNALLTQAPLLWVQLWSESSIDQTVSCIAFHALPRQSYSLTDLKRSACCCLPALIESRLNWQSHNLDFRQQELGEHTDNAALVASERADVEAYAQQLANNRFLPEQATGLTNLRAVAALWWKQSIERVSHRLYYEQWQLATLSSTGPTEEALSDMSTTPIDHYSALTPPDDTWWADPHMLQHQGTQYVFFEEMNIHDSLGHLSVARMDKNGQLSDVSRILEETRHLSYPFVFSHDNEVYMLPETASQRCVTLYKAHDFPHQWLPEKNLLSDMDLADTTLHYADNHWWMFTNSMSNPAVNERDELRLFHAADLHGPWLPHPLNPVITGVDRARQAGQLISDGIHWYRVSQYGAKRYGYGINFNRIDVLNTKHYQETPTARLIPDAQSPWQGCHSMGFLNGITILDRVIRRRR